MKPVSVEVKVESDVGDAIRQVKSLAETIGFDKTRVYYIAVATSELATNLLVHGGGGTLRASRVTDRPGISLETEDEGPGIVDTEQALQEGYSTAGGLGCGLPGIGRLMDDMAFLPTSQKGLHLRAIKWL